MVMLAPDQQAPLTDAEADTALRPLLTRETSLVIAVSGGVDSMVLMHLMHYVAQRHALSVKLLVATIDHGLRPESAEEAAFVAVSAERLGLKHVTRFWSGPKPATGIPAAARTARYDLLAEVAHEASTDAVAMAHTRDDQAETVLMRLGRGSGVDGLSGMGPMSKMPTRSGAIRLLRPCLDIAKSRLVATATSRNISWREDPSNAHTAYERPRVRQALALLEGLGISTVAITRSARRLRSAREALTSETVRRLSDQAFLRLDPLGYATLDLASWRTVPNEIRVRILAATIRHVGGVDGYLSLSQLEQIERGLAQAAFTTTYARTRISLTSEAICIQRETARAPAVETIVAGQTVIWDNRFRITRGMREDRAPWKVRRLGAGGLKLLRDQGLVPARVSADILHAVPAFWCGDTLLSCPPIAACGPACAPINADGEMWFMGRDSLLGRLSRNDTED